MSSRSIFPSTRARPLETIERFEREVDVLVVGYGGAGACAAIEAAREGSQVLLLEAAGGGGGCTALSGGHLYLGGGTRVQRAVGIDDSPEQMFQYLMAGGDGPDEARARLYADESVEHFDWLVELGVPFKDSIFEERTFQQTTDDCLIWSGNEKAHPFHEKARPAARGHKVAHKDDAGHVLWKHLSAAVAALGADVHYDTTGQALVVNSSGRVVGVVAQQYGRELAFCARRAVVLATGGFIMNTDMLEQHLPKLRKHIDVINRHGNPHDDGSGIRMGAAAGGVAVRMAEMFITTLWYPPASLTYGIAVNARGERFINEDCYHGRVAGAAFSQPDGIAYLIADNACYGQPREDVERVATEGSIIELEGALALPAGTLCETVARYNEHAVRGLDPLFHKHSSWLKPLSEPPFAALNISLGKSGYTAFTLGGLRALPTGEVLSAEGDEVPGLYAAGANAAGIPRSAGTYCSGQSVGDATFFGRRAGRSAAAFAPW